MHCGTAGLGRKSRKSVARNLWCSDTEWSDEPVTVPDTQQVTQTLSIKTRQGRA